MPKDLDLVVLDATDTAIVSTPREGRADGTSRERIGLAPIWTAGAVLHRIVGAADAWLGARSWDEALAWAVATASERGARVRSLQAWGHGGWGFMRIGESRLDERALGTDHELAPRVDALRDRLSGSDALVWFRCCSAFGHGSGRRFACLAAERLRARVAGHTHIIGFFQSGTHSVRPGAVAGWDPGEGLRGDRALKSSPFAPNTVTCLRCALPRGY
jgi:hypothetical protein